MRPVGLAPPFFLLPISDRRRGLAGTLEVVSLGGGAARLFFDLESPKLRLGPSELAELRTSLGREGVREVLFEDLRPGTIGRIFVDLGWRQLPPERPPRVLSSEILVEGHARLPKEWASIGSPPSPDELASHMHGYLFSDGAPFGAVWYTAYGDYVRVRSGEPPTEGFARAASVGDVPRLLRAFQERLTADGRRFVVLGPEFAPFTTPRDSYPMWTMALAPLAPSYPDEARPLQRSELSRFVQRLAEYEGRGWLKARRLALSYLRDREFRILLSPGGEGFVLVQTKGRSALIYDIYVTPAFQGHGIGKVLLSSALQSCVGRVDEIRLNTSYPRAVALYEQFGFQIVTTSHGVPLRPVRFAAP